MNEFSSLEEIGKRRYIPTSITCIPVYYLDWFSKKKVDRDAKIIKILNLLWGFTK